MQLQSRQKSQHLKSEVNSLFKKFYKLTNETPSTPWYAVVEERKDSFPHPSPTGQEELEQRPVQGLRKGGVNSFSVGLSTVNAARAGCWKSINAVRIPREESGQGWGRSTSLQIYCCYQFPKLFLESSGLGVE